MQIKLFVLFGVCNCVQQPCHDGCSPSLRQMRQTKVDGRHTSIHVKTMASQPATRSCYHIAQQTPSSAVSASPNAHAGTPFVRYRVAPLTTHTAFHKTKCAHNRIHLIRGGTRHINHKVISDPAAVTNRQMMRIHWCPLTISLIPCHTTIIKHLPPQNGIHFLIGKWR